MGRRKQHRPKRAAGEEDEDEEGIGDAAAAGEEGVWKEPDSLSVGLIRSWLEHTLKTRAAAVYNNNIGKQESDDVKPTILPAHPPVSTPPRPAAPLLPPPAVATDLYTHLKAAAARQWAPPPPPPPKPSPLPPFPIPNIKGVPVLPPLFRLPLFTPSLHIASQPDLAKERQLAMMALQRMTELTRIPSSPSALRLIPPHHPPMTAAAGWALHSGHPSVWPTEPSKSQIVSQQQQQQQHLQKQQRLEENVEEKQPGVSPPVFRSSPRDESLTRQTKKDSGPNPDSQTAEVEKSPQPRKLVRGQDVWLGKGQEQTRQILKCMWCGESYRSLAELTEHMRRTRHYTKVISQEQISSWAGGGGARKAEEDDQAADDDGKESIIDGAVSPLTTPEAATPTSRKRASTSSSSDGSKRKKQASLPVRKLLEMERGDNKDGDDDVDRDVERNVPSSILGSLEKMVEAAAAAATNGDKTSPAQSLDPGGLISALLIKDGQKEAEEEEAVKKEEEDEGDASTPPPSTVESKFLKYSELARQLSSR